ncbi:MAG: RluA family pseudouridine synthase [Candidatus Coatesbacteria bacterium]|nr:RluA family pseudouridine synthase [Candidatus Coatesbacteria bacterium]
METGRSQFSVSSIIESVRIDIFLFKIMPNKSRTYFRNLLREEKILVNNRKVKPSYCVQKKDTITIEITEIAPMKITPVDMKLNIIYEDDDLIIINKPPFMVVHPGAGNLDNTMVHGLLHHTRSLSSIGGEHRLGIVHRLDKNTSGCMVIAKNDDTHRSLMKDFKEHNVLKRYLALVWGYPPKSEFIIENMIERSNKNHEKQRIVREGGRYSKTNFKVLKYYPGFCLLEAFPLTGRTHQLRIQLSDAGFPIVGDNLYGNDDRKIKQINANKSAALIIKKKVNRQLLHSSYLQFFHPRNNNKMIFRAPLSDDFTEILHSVKSFIIKESINK